MPLTTNLVAFWHMDEASGDAIDSISGHNGVDQNTVTNAAGVVGTARQFTRANTEYFIVPDHADFDGGAAQDFSVSAWVYLDTYAQARPIILKISGSNGWQLGADPSGQGFYFTLTAGGTTYTTSTDTAANIELGRWYHVVGVSYASATRELWVDGHRTRKAGDATWLPNDSGYAGDNAGDIWIGRNSAGSRMDGRLDEIRYWSRALSAADIAELYTTEAGLTNPPAENPLKLWAMTSGAGNGKVGLVLPSNGQFELRADLLHDFVYPFNPYTAIGYYGGNLYMPLSGYTVAPQTVKIVDPNSLIETSSFTVNVIGYPQGLAIGTDGIGYTVGSLAPSQGSTQGLHRYNFLTQTAEFIAETRNVTNNSLVLLSGVAISTTETGILYGISNSNTGLGDSTPNSFWKINSATGICTLVGALGVTNPPGAGALCYTPGGIMYAIIGHAAFHDSTAAKTYTININTGAATLVGQTVDTGSLDHFTSMSGMPVSPPCTVEVTPSSVTLDPTEEYTFTANEAVNWSVTAGGGYIDSDGNYIASGIPGSYTVTGTSVASPSCTDTSTVTVRAYGFDDCGHYTGPTEFDVRLYNSSDPVVGKRLSWSSDGQELIDVVSSANFEIQERGGFGTGSLDLIAEWDEVALDGTERVDVWVYDSPAYRGYVRINQRDLRAPETAKPQMYGMIALLDQWVVKRKYAYGVDTEIGRIFEDIAVDYVTVAGHFINASIDGSYISGVTLQDFDPRGKSVAQAFNELADLSPNSVIWGVEMDATRPVPGDVLYMRPKPTTTSYVVAVGDNVQAFSYPVDTHDIVNSLIITGGPVKQPNLLGNGGFEELSSASEDSGNYLLNHDFELVAASWTLSGGTTVQFPGNGGAFGSGRSGTHWLECDRYNESATQTAFIVPGRNYTFSAWARLEKKANTNSFYLRMECMDASNVSQITIVKLFDGSSTPAINSEVYTKYEATVNLAPYPTVVKIKVFMVSLQGVASDDGVLFDDVGLYESEGAGSLGWHVGAVGAAVITDLDWDSRGTSIGPRSGGLCVHMDQTGASASANYGTLYTVASESPAANPSERYTCVLFWHVDGQGTSSDDAIEIEANLIKTDNALGTQFLSGIGVGSAGRGNPSNWQMTRVEIQTESNTARIQIVIRNYTTRDLYIDDVMLVQGEVPDEVQNKGGYWEQDTYQRSIKVNTSITNSTGATLASMLDSGVAQSIINYGEHESAVSNDLVTELDTAMAYASGTFNAKGLPKVSGSLTISGIKEIIGQEGKVRLINLIGPPDPLWPARASYSVGPDGINATIELGNERPDLASLLNLAAKKNT